MTAILLTLLFSFFAQSAKLDKKLDEARIEVIARQHLQMRLQTILSSVSHETASPPFYTKRLRSDPFESLIVLFDNGVDPDPAFSGPLLGRIYLDEKKNLSLGLWPLEKKARRPWRKEILLSHVDRYEFEFLGKKIETDQPKGGKVRPINSNFEWRTFWPKSQSGTPSMIRLSVWEEKMKEPLQFAFLIPSPEPMVTYREGGLSS